MSLKIIVSCLSTFSCFYIFIAFCWFPPNFIHVPFHSFITRFACLFSSSRFSSHCFHLQGNIPLKYLEDYGSLVQQRHLSVKRESPTARSSMRRGQGRSRQRTDSSADEKNSERKKELNKNSANFVLTPSLSNHHYVISTRKQAPCTHFFFVFFFSGSSDSNTVTSGAVEPVAAAPASQMSAQGAAQGAGEGVVISKGV